MPLKLTFATDVGGIVSDVGITSDIGTGNRGQSVRVLNLAYFRLVSI